MSAYLISYDLHTPGQKYDCIQKTITSICPRNWKMLQTVWMVNYSGNSTQLRDALKKYLDGNDELIVVKLNGEAAWSGPNLTKHSEWIKDTLNK